VPGRRPFKVERGPEGQRDGLIVDSQTEEAKVIGKLLTGKLKIVAVVMAVMMFATPLMAQQRQVSPTAQAKRDAEQDVNQTMWYFAGCLTCVGLAIAYLVAPDPPASRLMGKSPQYVASYTEAYKEAGRSKQLRAALIGCVAASVGYGCCIVVLMVL
jgi:cytochrome c553